MRLLNYYEFSTDKYTPAGLAKDFKTRPWTVSIEGLVKKKQTLDVDSIINLDAPRQHRFPLPRHLLWVVNRGELHELGFRLRLRPVNEDAQREADPRHYDRPPFH